MSFLDHLGGIVRHVLHIGEFLAQDAEPFVDLAFPEIAPLYNSVIGLAAASQATITQKGASAQKLGLLSGALVPFAEKFAHDNKLNWPVEDQIRWASAVVDTLNLIPAPSSTPAPTVIPGVPS